MRAPKAVPRVVLAGLGLFLFTLFAQSVKADTIDFGCVGMSACTGTVVQNGSNFNTLGIGVSASYESDPFTLYFDTSTGAISIAENGGPDQFLGTITGLSVSSTPVGSDVVTTLDFGVNWSTVPLDTGTWGVTVPPSGSVVSISLNGSALYADSVDIPIITPEPAVPVLLSAAMLALGLMRKRKAGVLA